MKEVLVFVLLFGVIAWASVERNKKIVCVLKTGNIQICS